MGFDIIEINLVYSFFCLKIIFYQRNSFSTKNNSVGFDSIEINLPLNFIDNICRLGSYKIVACIPNLSFLWCLKFFDQNSSA